MHLRNRTRQDESAIPSGLTRQTPKYRQTGKQFGVCANWAGTYDAYREETPSQMAFHNSKYLESFKKDLPHPKQASKSIGESTPARRYAVSMQSTGLFDRQGAPCFIGTVQSWYVIYIVTVSRGSACVGETRHL